MKKLSPVVLVIRLAQTAVRHLPPFLAAALIISTFILLFTQPIPVHAVSITVDTFDNDVIVNGNCSLREAIMAANSDTPVDNCAAGEGADTIILADGVYTLYEADNETDGNNGLPAIVSEIVIEGNGAIIERMEDEEQGKDGGFRFFHVSEGASLTLDNVTLQHGCVDFGGGYLGGAIYNKGHVQIQNGSQLTGNHADGGGGAVYNVTATAVLTITGAETRIGPDNSSFNGAALYNSHGATIVISDGATVDDNDGTNTGAVFNSSSSITVDNATISDNFGYQAGAIHNMGGGTAIIRNGAQIVDNEAIWRGGGLVNQDSTMFIESGSTVADNEVEGDEDEEEDFEDQDQGEYEEGFGGGIYNNAELSITNSTVAFNEASFGGGIYNEDGYTDLIIDSSTINNNTAVEGGGLSSYYGHETIVNSTFSANAASEDGGGLFLYGSETQIDFTTITKNIADSDEDYYGIGGGLFALYSEVEISSTILAGNKVENEDPFAPDCFNEYEGEDEDQLDLESPGLSVAVTLIGDNSGCEQIIDGQDGNIAGDSSEPVNPALGELGDNGGLTQTHNLIAGSLAIDAAGETCPDLDQRGVSRPIDGDGNGEAVCDMGAVETSLLNDAWPRARRIILTEEMEGQQVGLVDDDSVDILGQSRWYKFTISPESDVTVELSNLAVNYDITLYKDIAQVYAELATVENEAELVELTAEFAPDAYAPDIFSPDIFSPDIFSPDIFSPDIFSPDIFSPDIFSPDIFSPDIFSPDIFSPDIFSPDIFSPDIFSPDIFSPDIFSPDIFSPDPTIYSNAQLRSLIGVSALESTANESITVRTWSNSGDFYVRVRGRYGAFAPDQPFTLNVEVMAGGCFGFEPTELPFDTMPTAGDFKTIILVDNTRLGSTPDLDTALGNFAARPEVAGVVVPLHQDQRIVAANALADDFFDCPHAKNVLADDIKTIIDGYWDLNPLEYIVIVGNDDVIPFYRHPDQALLANESNYVPPVADATASQASLKLGYVLGQDRYGSKIDLSLRSDTLSLPELAVGRLVETPSDILNMINAYVSTNGLMPTPESSFITGYDFLEDAAEAVQAELELGTGQAANTLITPRDVSPADTDNPALWSADDLRNEFLTTPYDVVYLAGHFSAFSALAADYQTRMLASEVANSTVDMTNMLVFSTGCHSGYNIVNEHGIPNITIEPDWAQAFAQKGATLIAGTAYQYGDTDFLEYNERLYRDFALQLRAGSGPVAIGKALVDAKGVYLANTPELRPLHEKSLLEVTLYGFPMMQIDMPQGRNPEIGADSIVASTTAYANDPGATLGLEFTDINVPFLLEEMETELVDATDANNRFTTIHYEGSNGVVANTSEPVLPLEIRNVAVENTILRGIGFRGGSYYDNGGMLPLTGAATTEIRSVHAPFLAEAFFPVQPYSPNYIDTIMHPDGGATGLMMTPAQFMSDGPLSTTGIWRAYEDMAFRLFYSDNITTYGDNIPALANPPSIVSISALSDAGVLNFEVVVQGDPSAGLQEVWVTYTSSSGSFYEAWQSLDLIQDEDNSLLWTAVLPLDGNIPADMRYIVQAVNGVGLVSLAANGGEYYTPDDDPDPTQQPDADETTLTFISPPTSGSFGADITVTAELTSLGSPVAGQVVSISMGGQTRQAITDGSGRITVSMPLLGIPGKSAIKAAFKGNDTYLPSAAESPFTINKQGTVLTLSPDSAAIFVGEETGMVLTLTDALGRPLREKNIIIIISNGTDVLTISDITDYVGRVTIGAVDLPEGSYTIDAYFSGSIPLPSGPLTLNDVRYLPSSTSGTLLIETEVVDPTCDINAPDVNVIIGTEEDDIIFGTTGDDVIFGLGGNDRIFGRNGNDCIAGGKGDDEINGGNGDDQIFGDAGADQLLGSKGQDEIFGGPGEDFIDGNKGEDMLFGGDDADTILGGTATDYIDGGAGDDVLFGQNGNDTLLGGLGDDFLKGGNGNDLLNGGDDTDTCQGGNGTDVIISCEIEIESGRGWSTSLVVSRE